MAAFTTFNLQEELNTIQDGLPPDMVLQTCTRAFVQCTFSRGPYRQIGVRLQFPQDYPNQILIVELTSKVLPPQLLKKIQGACESDAESRKGSAQVLGVLNFIEVAFFNPFCSLLQQNGYRVLLG